MNATVEDYWQLTDQELYGLLGASLLGEALGLSPEEQDDQRSSGRAWFARQYGELQRRICTARVREVAGTNASDRIVDAFAVHQTLQEHDDYAVNAALLAVLIVRIGLGTFCSGAAAGSGT